MKIRIKDKYTLTTLDNLKGLYLLDDRGDILYINDFEVETVTETPPEKKAKSGYFVRKKDRVAPEPKKRRYLTKLEIHGYNADLNFIGVYNEEWCERLIARMEDRSYSFSLTTLRKKFLSLEKQFKAFGFTLQYPVPVEEHCTCDNPIVEQGENVPNWCSKCEKDIPIEK